MIKSKELNKKLGECVKLMKELDILSRNVKIKKDYVIISFVDVKSIKRC